MSLTPTKDAAHGRWREILPAIGVGMRLLNGKHQACPMCGGKDRFRYDDKRGDGGYYCSQCGPGTGLKLAQLINGWDFAKAAHEIDQIIGNLPPHKPAPIKPKLQSSREQLNELWRSGREIGTTDPAGTYLISRGLTAPRALRFVPRLAHYPTKTWHPGLIALFSDANGKAKQMQRLYLTDQGTKAEVEPNRMFMPGDMPDGGAIRLGEAAELMGVAEGIETALAASRRFGMVVWATTAEGLLQKWQPPAEARRIIVFADNDQNFVGQNAAYALAKRLMHEAEKNQIARAVEVRIPSAAGTDWADFKPDRCPCGQLWEDCPRKQWFDGAGCA